MNDPAPALGTPNAELRPAVPPPPPHRWRGPAGAGLLLAAVVFWVLAPLWPRLGGVIVGDPDTDAIRGLWGLDHLRRSLLPPWEVIWSTQVNFPAGVAALVLPWASGVLLAPAGLIAGPVAGYNLSVALLLWGLGAAAAGLVRLHTGSWAAGAAVGAAALTQPMLLHAVADGTVEHLAIWAVPAFLAAASHALRQLSPRWGMLAGVLGAVVALDSPYHAIYTLLAGALVLPWSLRWPRDPAARTQLGWTLGAMTAVLALGALAVGLLYRLFPLDEQQGLGNTDLWRLNATDLRTWWQYDFQDAVVRDSSLAPTTIPMPVLWAALALIAVGLPRSLPWALAGAAMLALSMGLNARIPAQLGQWLGGAGQQLGASILALNQQLLDVPGFGHIRFPQRWLVPAALMLLTGAGFGLARVCRLARGGAPALAALLAGGAAVAGVRSSQIDLGFPAQEAPAVEFASWIADQPGPGAVLTLPRMRPPPRSGKRADMIVFADLASSLSTSDVQYFQVIHRRPVLTYPDLKTLAPFDQGTPVYALLRDWDDLANPLLADKPIPASAYDPRGDHQRQQAIDHLRAAGLRWIAVDLGAYNEESLEHLRRQLGDRIGREEAFQQGDGVLVIELR